jgi:PleD family two-component response regulator
MPTVCSARRRRRVALPATAHILVELHSFTTEPAVEHIDHILVVDDDRDIRELVTDYLEKSGYRATGAANGKAMWSVLQGHHVDLIVLDIMLPGEDG